jgi:hypothetical protein
MPIAPYGVTLKALDGTNVKIEGYCGDDYGAIRIYYGSNIIATLSGLVHPGTYFSYTDTLNNPAFWNTAQQYSATGDRKSVV